MEQVHTDTSNTKIHIKTVECEHCGCQNTVSVSDSICKCMACGERFNVQESLSKKTQHGIPVNIDFSSLQSAKNYIDLKLEETDWDNFAKLEASYTIKEVDDLLEKLKVKYGDQPQTWIIAFDYLIFVIGKKVDVLDRFLDDIINRFVNTKRKSDCYNEFDTLRQGIRHLHRHSVTILQQLESYLNFATRFGGEPSEIERLKKAYQDLEAKLKNINYSQSLDDYPKVQKAIEQAREDIHHMYTSKGIDAHKNFEQATQYIEEKKYSEAYNMLLDIPEYPGVQEMMQCMHFSVIEKEMYLYNTIFHVDYNRFYPYKHRLYENVSLCGRVDNMIGLFGDYIVGYNTDDSKEYIAAHYQTKKTHRVSFYGTLTWLNDSKWFVHPRGHLFKLVSDKKDKKNRKKILATYEKNEPLTPFDRFNPNDIIMIDVVTHQPKVIIEHILEPIGFINNVLYYQKAKTHKKWYWFKRRVESIQTYAKNLLTNEIKTIPISDVTLHAITEQNQMVYSEVHGSGNINIKMIDLNTMDKPTVLVNNAHAFEGLIEHKVFYTVGSTKMKALASIDLNTLKFNEVLKYMDQILFYQEGWLYILHINEHGIHTLYRQSVDGKVLTLVASGMKDGTVFQSKFNRDRWIVDGYIYYNNYDNVLCKVRLNGSGYKELVYDVDQVLLVTKNQIYYSTLDTMVENDHTVTFKSFYAMYGDGSERRKILNHYRQIDVYSQDIILVSQECYFESKKDIYEHIDDPQITAQLDKMYAKLKKANKDTKFSNNIIIYEYNTKSGDLRIKAIQRPYPTVNELKAELKERMKA